jgi:NH3-dependent NAD+ synthetase
MKLITELIKSELIKEQTNFEWDKHTHIMINLLIDLLNSVKGQELRNIEHAFRAGFHTEDRWGLDLEVYDHILMHYNEEIMTYEEFQQEKKRVAFFKKNFSDEGGQDA